MDFSERLSLYREGGMLSDEDIKKIEIHPDNMIQGVRGILGDDDFNLNQFEQDILMSAVTRYRRNEKFSYFNALPSTLKNALNEMMNSNLAQVGAVGSENRQMKNMLAQTLFDNIIQNNYITKAFNDISTFSTSELDKCLNVSQVDISSSNAKQRREYEVGFMEKYEQLKDTEPEKAEKFKLCSEWFKEAYTLSKMYDMYKNTGKLKAKKIEIEKFSRICKEFNSKYLHSSFVISDVSSVVYVLDRCIDSKYDIDTIKRFVIAFIKFTKSFNPDNVHEHVFMFYFIHNILSLEHYDKNNNEEIEYYNKVKNNITSFLDLIVEKQQNGGNK